MNWSVGDWLHSKIPAKSSPIPMLSTLERESVTKPCFPKTTHDSARRVSKPGSPNPQHKFRVRILNPQVQHPPWGKRVMQKLADLVTAAIVGELGFGQYTGGRTSPTDDEIAQLAFTFYESRGRPDVHHIEDWWRVEQELVRHYA